MTKETIEAYSENNTNSNHKMTKELKSSNNINTKNKKNDRNDAIKVNSCPWSSYGHLNISLAEQAKKRIVLASIPVILIQRWWRKFGTSKTSHSKQGIYPIVIGDKAYSVRRCVHYLKNSTDDDVTVEFSAYEKLDGTNFGVRCDGAMFGRRLEVFGDKYMKVDLKAANIPTNEKVQTVKKAMLGKEYEFSNNARLILYGELMCNPGKFRYEKRDLGNKFYCFGGTIDVRTSEVSPEAMASTLCAKGFCATAGDISVCLVLNKNLEMLLESVGIFRVPLLAPPCPLRDLCFSIKEILMSHDELEGVVLTGRNGTLYKWKTRQEDEASGFYLLTTLLNENSEAILDFAGVDVEFAKLLLDVSTRTNPEENDRKSRRRNKKPKTKVVSSFASDTLDRALESAKSKYDALDAFFEKNQMASITNLLLEELMNDLDPQSDVEKKNIHKVVKKDVGVAYGKWKAANK